MCGIIAVVRRATDRPIPSEGELVDPLASAHSTLGGSLSLDARLDAAAADVESVDAALRGVPGLLALLTNRDLAVRITSESAALMARVVEIELELDEGLSTSTPAELERMKALVRQAMEEGAMGVGSSLIYAPAFYAQTDELIALVAAAREYNGGYISHIRSD